MTMIISSNALNYLAVVRRCLDLLAGDDAPAAAAMFSPTAVVHCPLGGVQTAAIYFEALASAPRRTAAQDERLFVSASGSRSVCAWLAREWQLSGGTRICLPCIDVFDFDEHGLIDQLTIFHDCAAFQQAGDDAYRNAQARLPVG
ncbi:hypothetical protein M8A51_13890 [Schlegelella sp. S2-27]|uniref:SnoaL-like domain-containing protein n=1 Tax=Caldimonas mangrovi TaxID=2944811 RepID=A0ABT0YPG1_9BURK|nr:hypothetical protein [Caldimonas mangrovi]MCM5680620.1 hypothetical protein [Caldimonas mangrovi]